MPALRKIYNQGNTPVISLPRALVSAVGANIGTTAAIYPINPTSLLFEILTPNDQGALGLPRFEHMRTVIFRKIYRQGNSFVISISNFVLERIGIAVGDSLSLAQISENAFTGTARSATQVSMDKAQGRVSYHKMTRANADSTLPN